jgi:hypothetical protein
MAHFAQINDENIVVDVIVIGNEFEEQGQDYCANYLKLGGTWIQTSYNAKFRGKFAGIGDSYDPEKDEFIQKYCEPGIINFPELLPGYNETIPE